MMVHILFIVVKAFMFFILLYCADKIGLLMVRNSPTAKLRRKLLMLTFYHLLKNEPLIC